LVSLKFSSLSKLVAWSASAFNIVGVIIMLPFFGVLKNIALSFSDIPALQVAMAFTVSNTFTSLFFLLLINPTIRRLQKHKCYRPAIQVAMSFTVSNTFTSLFFLLLINPTIRRLQKHKWYRQSFEQSSEIEITS